MSYEVLAAAGVGTRQSHPDSAPFISMWIHFVSDGVARPAVAIVAWITILRDEVWNHAMESRIPIVSRPRQAEKVPRCYWRVITEQLELNWPAHSLDRRARIFASERGEHHRPHDLLVP